MNDQETAVITAPSEGLAKARSMHSGGAMNPFHTAVWIDHKQAKVFHIENHSFDEGLVHAPKSQVHHDPAKAEHFFHEVTERMSSAGEILVLGPGTAKLELVKHIHKHHHGLVDKIIGVETVDHPTDKQVVAYCRQYFLREDKLRGIAPLA